MKSTQYLTLFAMIFVAATGALAQQSNGGNVPFYITSPLNGASYKSGDKAHIAWINGMDQDVEVRVLQGSDPSAMQPTGYSFNVDGSKGSYVWQLPNDLPSNGRYAFQFVYNNDDGTSAYTFSDAFSVNGGNDAAPSAAAATSSSGAAVASGSSKIPFNSAAPKSAVSAVATPAAGASSAAASNLAPSASMTASVSGSANPQASVFASTGAASSSLFHSSAVASPAAASHAAVSSGNVVDRSSTIACLVIVAAAAVAF
ncbi:hypothetical protein BCR43DRAFT_524643 [Syncephalastrum racemosum]|uniref:Yeast cell wall synthesis Kre9/Knh1-like N-terminal domain-containing protein n=1 Tax=Syncephalastrum racemosum TaxID=13706 RepID=A0A1X2HE28_SYNRA|nr:hypothetical protein BCR43DRAFT_524643 [Syncephalastrum racemosum]